MEDKKIPKRSEVPVENTWRLEDIYATDDLWFEEYEELKCPSFHSVALAA